MATVARLTYEDGSTEDVEVRPILMVKAERKFKGDIPPIEGTLYACWLKLKPGPPFDVWLETVDNFEKLDAEEPEEGPLGGEPSPDS